MCPWLASIYPAEIQKKINLSSLKLIHLSDSELNSFRYAKNAILANISHLWVSRPRTSSGLPAVLSCRKRRRSRRRRRRCCRAGCGGSGGSSRRRRRACLAERGPRVARRCAATVRPEGECRASFDVHLFVSADFDSCPCQELPLPVLDEWRA